MKNRFSWKEMTVGKKLRFILRISVSLIVIFLAILSIFDVVDSSKTNKYIIPLVGFMMVLMGIDEYQNNKILAYLSFGVAIFIFVLGLSILLTF